MIDLTGKICLVTGASHGIGRGVALQLATHGATCYITGRNLQTLKLVEDEVKSRGLIGKLIIVECDHSSDENVERLFKKIAKEQNNQLDLLVNNDLVNNVGLRGNYICAVFAARMMVPHRKGLIINVSSVGGKSALGYPTYHIGKVGNDRMAIDCGYELAKYNIAFLSLWPGIVKTELITKHYEEVMQKSFPTLDNLLLQRFYQVGETPEHVGIAVVHLFNDKNIMRRSRQIEITTDVSCEFKFKDIDGSTPANLRSLRLFLHLAGASKLASYFPNWLRIPKSIYFWLLGFTSPADKIASKFE